MAAVQHCELSGNNSQGTSDWSIPLCFVQSYHAGQVMQHVAPPRCLLNWRIREKIRTVGIGLSMCMNIGVDPPDVFRPSPCARDECWTNPFTLNSNSALETITDSLQKQYEQWQARARFKICLDPTLEDVKKCVASLRRHAKDERVLFHYNGHGVPRPTRNGEVWVFNKHYTQYIPLSLYDLQDWLSTPAIMVWECNNAGVCVEEYEQFAKQHDEDLRMRMIYDLTSMPPMAFSRTIQLGACGADETLPLHSSLPADLFTSCLTTPIRAAILYWKKQSFQGVPDAKNFDYELIPGRISDRRTPLGELNWIFTAVTDTIAWNMLDRETFQSLFRQDQLVASLFRNFLLACRVLPAFGCHPVSRPQIPRDVGKHWMWRAWDIALDGIIRQICDAKTSNLAYEPSPFFADHLKSFEVWLRNGWDEERLPEHLPIVLQVLLSAAHRIPALKLLMHFLDIGPRAVLMSLQVGILPYVSKLLHSPAKELRVMLVFVWARIVAVDPSVRNELIKDNGFPYFIDALTDYQSSEATMKPEFLAQAAFVLATLVQDYPVDTCECIGACTCAPTNQIPTHHRQETCCNAGLPLVLLNLLSVESPLLRRWCLLCLGRMWRNNPRTRSKGISLNAHLKLFPLVTDPSAEVRTALVFALGCFLSQPQLDESSEESNNTTNGSHEMFRSIVIDQAIGSALSQLVHDGCHLVRMELCTALERLVSIFKKEFSMAVNQVHSEQYNISDLQSTAPFTSLSRRVTPSTSPLLTPTIASTVASTPTQNAFDFSASRTSSAPATAHDNPALRRTSSTDDEDEWVRVTHTAARGTEIDCGTSPNSSHYKPPPSSPNLSQFRGANFVSNFPEAAVVLSRQAGLSLEFSPAVCRSLAFGMERIPSIPSPTVTPTETGPSLDDQLEDSNSVLVSSPAVESSASRAMLSSFAANCASMWRAVLLLDEDPHPDVQLMGRHVREIVEGPISAPKKRKVSLAMSLPASPVKPRHSPGLVSHLQDAFSQPASSSQLPRKTAVSHREVAAIRSNESNSSVDSISRLFSFSRGNGGPIPTSVSTVTGELGVAWSRGGGTATLQRARTAPSTPSHHRSARQSCSGITLDNDSTVAGIVISEESDEESGDDDVMFANLTSGFDNWSTSQFAIPAEERHRETDKNGQIFLERHWRFEQNRAVRQRCMANKAKFGDKLHLDDQQFLCRGNEIPTAMRFHPYQSELVVSDKQGITVFDLEKGDARHTLLNRCTKEAKTVTLDYVNAHDKTLLLSGSSDGCIRLWRNYATPKEELVTAWRALNEMLPMSGGVTSGLVVDWEQDSGILFASGYIKVIRIWDTQREQIIQDIPTGANSCITSISSDVAGKSLLIAGCGDGTVRLYDRRLSPKDSLVHMLKEHAGWVVKVFLDQGPALGNIITASTAGDVLYWDPRFTKSVKSINTKTTISCMDVHPNYPVFAVGSKSRFIKIYSITSGDLISTIQHHEGFLGQRIQPVTTLGFHPYQALLGAGFSDSLVSVYRDLK